MAMMPARLRTLKGSVKRGPDGVQAKPHDEMLGRVRSRR